MLTETSYGIVKRFNFVKSIIEELNPISILDIGCGTGTNLTTPLAVNFPNISFIGVDTDKSSIEFATKCNNLPNLVFKYPDEINEQKFDLIIASEVLEHVDKPEDFLLYLKDKLSQNGKIFLTLPNGYGPSEIMSFLEALLYLCGFLKIVRYIKRILMGTRNIENRDTLAISPHINFFSYNKLLELYRGIGLRIIKFRPRVFLCGFLFDHLIKGDRLTGWNSHISDYLPRFLNSGWMFVIAPKLDWTVCQKM